MPDIPVHVLLAVQASYHLLLKKKNPKSAHIKMSIYINSLNNHVELSLQNNSKTSYFRNFLLDFFLVETQFLKLDLLYKHSINIKPWLNPIIFLLKTNLTWDGNWPSLSFWIGSLSWSSCWDCCSFLARFNRVSLEQGKKAARWL